MSRSLQNAMMIVFFFFKYSQSCYDGMGALRKLHERIRKKRIELRDSKSFVVHHNNAPSHRAQLVKKFLNKKICSLFPCPLFARFSRLPFFPFSETEISIEGVT